MRDTQQSHIATAGDQTPFSFQMIRDKENYIVES